MNSPIQKNDDLMQIGMKVAEQLPDTARRHGAAGGIGGAVGGVVGSLVGGPFGAALGASLCAAVAVAAEKALR